MALSLDKIKAVAAEEAKVGKDLNIQTAGGDYKPPAAGVTRLRFISYVELGVHTKRSAKFGDKTKPMARFGFELSGPNHEPKEIEGKKYPYTIYFEEPIGTGTKNNYSKLFKLMVADYPGAKNFAQLLGEGFRGVVVHREWKDAGGNTKVAAELKHKDTGYTIKGLVYQDEETGEPKKVKVGPALTPLSAMLWNHADTEQWDSLFIPGTYDDGGTKNKVQEKIKQAENFIGSPIYNALVEAGREEETVPVAKGAPEGEEQEAEDDASATAEGAASDDAPFDGTPVEQEAAATVEEEDEEAALLAQLAAAKAKKAAAAKAAEAAKQEGVKKAPASPAKPTSAAGKGKGAATPAKPATARKSAPAKTDGDPLSGL